MARRKTLEEIEAEQDTSLVPMPVTAITPLQETFIGHLLAGRTISEAALVSGISQRTACRWLAPGHAVCIEFEKQRLQLVGEFRARMSALTGLALDTLQGALSEEVDLRTRLDVAKFLYLQNMHSIHQHLALPGTAEGLISDLEYKLRFDNAEDKHSSLMLWVR